MSHCCQIYRRSKTHSRINASLSRRWQLILAASSATLSRRIAKSTQEPWNPPLTLVTPLYLLLPALFHFNRQASACLDTLPAPNSAHTQQHPAHWLPIINRQASHVPCALSQPEQRLLTARASPCVTIAARSIQRHCTHACSPMMMAARESSLRSAAATATTFLAYIRKHLQTPSSRCAAPAAKPTSAAITTNDMWLAAVIELARSSDAYVAMSSSKSTNRATTTIWPLAQVSRLLELPKQETCQQ